MNNNAIFQPVSAWLAYCAACTCRFHPSPCLSPLAGRGDFSLLTWQSLQDASQPSTGCYAKTIRFGSLTLPLPTCGERRYDKKKPRNRRAWATKI
jgi:hypothetical protein